MAQQPNRFAQPFLDMAARAAEAEYRAKHPPKPNRRKHKSITYFLEGRCSGCNKWHSVDGVNISTHGWINLATWKMQYCPGSRKPALAIRKAKKVWNV